MPEPLTLTVDAAVRRRMVTDLCRHNLRTLRGVGMLSVVTSGGVVLLLWHNLFAALVVAGLHLLARIARWWIQLTRNLAKRLPTGQVVSVGHTATGDLVIRDTDEVWLPRGSATAVVRAGSVTVVHGRAVQAIVPTALLSDQDAAFLEGHAGPEPTQPATEDPLDLPLAMEITAQVQADLVAARRHSYLASGEFAMTIVGAVVVLAPCLFLASWRTSLVVAAVVAIPLGVSYSVLYRACAGLRRAYPVGHTVQARVDDDSLVLTMVHGALRVHFSDFDARRLRGRTVELRTRKGRPLANVTLPLGLFDEAALQHLTTAVPRTF